MLRYILHSKMFHLGWWHNILITQTPTFLKIIHFCCVSVEYLLTPILIYNKHVPVPCVEFLCGYFSVAQGSHSQCVNDHHILLDASSSGYISNGVTERTIQGSGACPWAIQVLPGQTINLTLIDFGVWGRHASSATDMGSGSRSLYCHKYAVIHEGDPVQETTVCASSLRTKNIYMSKSNKIEIILPRPVGDQPVPKFLIHYEGRLPLLSCFHITTLLKKPYKRLLKLLKVTGTAWTMQIVYHTIISNITGEWEVVLFTVQVQWCALFHLY